MKPTNTPLPSPEVIRQALEASKAHWQRMVDNGINGPDTPYSEHCAFCALFLHKRDCNGCPVAKRLGSHIAMKHLGIK